MSAVRPRWIEALRPSSPPAAASAGQPRRNSLGDLLGGARTPAAPGPGPLTTESLRFARPGDRQRVTAMLAGDYRSAFAGTGSEFHQLRPYQPGDDVRRIDWNVTARTGEPHVRVELAERVLITWLVFDASASMRFGTADRRKADVAEGVAIAVGHVSARRGNRLGIVTFGDGPPRFRQPREGRRELLLTLETIRAAPAGNGTLEEALQLVTGIAAAHRSLVVVVSDFRGARTWEPSLAAIAARGCNARRRDPRSARAGAGRHRRALPGGPGVRSVSDRRQSAGRGVPEPVRAVGGRREGPELSVYGGSTPSGSGTLALSTEGDWFLGPLALFLAPGRPRMSLWPSAVPASDPDRSSDRCCRILDVRATTRPAVGRFTAGRPCSRTS